MYQSLEVDCLPILSLKFYTDMILPFNTFLKGFFDFLSSVERKMLNKPPFDHQANGDQGLSSSKKDKPGIHCITLHCRPFNNFLLLLFLVSKLNLASYDLKENVKLKSKQNDLQLRSIRTGQTEVSCKMPLLKMTYSGQPIGMSHPFSDHKRGVECKH